MSRGFRVWDEQTKSYEWDREFVLSSSGELMELYSNHNGTWEYHFADTDRFIVEHETGLKDKNGKEIYEGDVMRFDAIDYEIYWSSDFSGWHNRRTDKSERIYGSNSFEEVTRFGSVIGNIHENKELLGGKE